MKIAVREIASASPDCVYHSKDSGCRYTIGTCANGSSGCLIGQALVKAEWATLKELGKIDGEGVIDIANVLSGSFGIDTKKLCERSRYDAEWLESVQQIQDRRKPWGVAVQFADKEYSEKLIAFRSYNKAL